MSEMLRDVDKDKVMNVTRRFTLPSLQSAHQVECLPPTGRIRTWSDSVVHDQLQVDWELERAEAQRRRSSLNSSGGHVTDFLASQTLALLLLMPITTSSAALCFGPEDVGDVERRSSDLSGSSSHPSIGGGKLAVDMASSGDALRRVHTTSTINNTINNSNTSYTSNNSEASSVTRLSLPDELSTAATTTTNNNNNSRPPSPRPVKDSSSSERQRSYQLKKFSQSTPALQLHYDLNNLGRYKSRQKKFLRLFPGVSRDECVLNYYACALVGDLLLQGHLYVTYNYFAFHSNVFGYVTKTLIPVAEVKRVTKEKTAKFIPNALGITTHTEKHLFSSLMSRDVTYRLAMSVWKKFHFPNRMDLLDCVEGEREIEVSSQNGEQSSNDSFSHNSADALLQGLSHPTSAAVASEGTSTDLDENDSAIEHSYSPTPEHEEMDNRVSALDQLSAASTALSSSSSHFFNFLTPWSSSNQDDCDVDRHDSMHLANDTSHERNANYWAYIGICFLLVMLCLSACILWYRMYLLHSNLEYRLASHSSEADREVITWPNSLYSPQMQELVETLNVLLSSHSSNDDLKDVEKEATPARST